MNRTLHLLALLGALAGSYAGGAAFEPPTVGEPNVAAPARPNFIFINIDDLGYADIGPFGSTLNRTPNLDRMAKEGRKLASFCAAPVCSPSRAALMTGCYPTVHNAHEFAGARFHHEDAWLDVNPGYTYGVACAHILPEYQRTNPARPVILGETGYEAEPNAIELLPDTKRGDLLWIPVLAGAADSLEPARHRKPRQH